MFYCCITVLSLLLTFFAVQCNQMLGSHTGGLVGSLQPAIHSQLLAAAYIAENGFQH